MATYAVGDVQGCFEPLLRLLDEVGFDPSRDRLWLTGDLVNRGPDSLGVLRWAQRQGDRLVVVLGNHDLHLLALAHGHGRARRRDSLTPVLDAPDRDELLDWLRRQELMHVEGGFAMVHAGLLPAWSIAKALSLAREVEAVLRGPDPARLFASMYGDTPDEWDDALVFPERHRVIINALTRLRMLNRSGAMDLSFSGPPADAPPGHVCWFDARGRASAGTPVVCGHWAALGLFVRDDLLALDSGCAWRRELTAVRLEDRAVFQVGCA
jgi:bis(5'-nucleosyl)-tetraphosphatase (symmetrical)